MDVKENYSLKTLNTFGIEVKTKYFASFSEVDTLEALIDRSAKHKRMILGGGSNILFSSNFDGYTIKNDIRGVEVIKEDERHVYVKAGAGENWHSFVMFCLDRDLAGVENLSLIPGNVGASPMQNIGAYGVEIKDVFHQLEAFHIREKKMVTFSASDCEFGYRESVFKNRYRNDFVITEVVYRLNKEAELNTSYGAVKEELEKLGKPPSIRSVSQAVINIRSSKLPDPREIGNAGSFFKNPTVSASRYEELIKLHPDLPGYPQENGKVKLAAGWLIEKCGWKGYRRGDAGCHARQALVLVNYGNASGREVFDLSEDIRQSVVKQFGVELEREVNIV